jgi:hypothetical protein
MGSGASKLKKGGKGAAPVPKVRRPPSALSRRAPPALPYLQGHQLEGLLA